MPNPLTSEERARLIEDLRTAAVWAIGDKDAAHLVEQAAAELARTADDARDARRLRFLLREVDRCGSDYNIFPYDWDQCRNSRERWTIVGPIYDASSFVGALDLDMAALASSKSEAAEGGEDGRVAARKYDDCDSRDCSFCGGTGIDEDRERREQQYLAITRGDACAQLRADLAASQREREQLQARLENLIVKWKNVDTTNRSAQITFGWAAEELEAALAAPVQAEGEK